VEKRELKRQVAALQHQLQGQISARNEAFTRLLQEQQALQAATSHALAVGASLSWYQKQQEVARDGLLPESTVEAMAAGADSIPPPPQGALMFHNPGLSPQHPTKHTQLSSSGPLPGLLGGLRSGAQGVAPLSAEVLIRRHTELQAAYDQVRRRQQDMGCFL
jgi:hypothetical protein